MDELEYPYVRVHTAPHLYDVDVREGDTFPIVGEDDSHILVEVFGYELAFTKEKDSNGVSYETWLEIVTEVE